ncbi:MAG: hypothetical protein QG625_2265 [Cyanobacteriota bacterium erpe_2018_sw_39hr_WHONDRS-SW48-000098_B_bin.30]|jgi:hypothetical protein|nr:hypothetical protein [Cyanobacteriota bacterium erpe_2018_sw_39hr_WHONDRS-SW48-000098_B_bin.30]
MSSESQGVKPEYPSSHRIYRANEDSSIGNKHESTNSNLRDRVLHDITPTMFFENLDKGINRVVEERIRRGDYVAPPGQPSHVAAAHRAVEVAMGKAYPGFDDGSIAYPGGWEANNYASKARMATFDTFRKESAVAGNLWQSLSPRERQIVEHEQAKREEYDHWSIYRTKNNPPATPHLDAFTKRVEQAIAPIEKAREQKLHKVWHELPVENKAAIIRSIEINKHYKAL